MVKASRIGPIERATNRAWDWWLAFMERIDAKSLDHHEIALKVFEELDGAIESHAWWAQAVTVAYEQHIGRRLPGQRPDGTFQTSVSKSTDLGMQELMNAWVEFAKADPTVTNMIADEPRVSGTEKRITWRVRAADGSSIVVTSEPKKNGTATIVATQTGLPSFDRNLDAKELWAGVVGRFLDFH
ncbi:MAG: hypothetical protein R6W77_10225 [Trueperaceae bacterium]